MELVSGLGTYTAGVLVMSKICRVTLPSEWFSSITHEPAVPSPPLKLCVVVTAVMSKRTSA